MLKTIEGGSRPAVYIKEAREILKTLGRAKPVRRGPDTWENYRAAGLVRDGIHEDTMITVVSATGKQIEAAVRGTVVIEDTATLFVLEDSAVMAQIFPKTSRSV
jgi:hypothetical protein